MEEQSYDRSKVILTFLVAAAAGAAIGYLLTSGKGKEVLADLEKTANKVKEDLKGIFEQADDLHTKS